MSSFRITSTRFQSSNGTTAVWSNQQPDCDTCDENESQILFLNEDGSPSSSRDFVFIPNIAGVRGATGLVNLFAVNGEMQVNGSASFLSSLACGRLLTGCFTELGVAENSNTSYIDFHSRGYYTDDWDARIMCSGGGTGGTGSTGMTGPGLGNVFFQAASVNFNSPIRVGSLDAVPFRLDYGGITGFSGANPAGRVYFKTLMFSDPPKVTLTLQSVGAIGGGAITGANPGLYVTATECDYFEWNIHGTVAAANSNINWIALGV